jgi:chitodextrinase
VNERENELLSAEHTRLKLQNPTESIKNGNVMPTYNERARLLVHPGTVVRGSTDVATPDGMLERKVRWTSWLGVRRGSGGSGGLRRRGLRSLRFHALLTALLLAVAALIVPGAASAATGDVGVEGPSHSGTGTPTGTKRAVSALWFNDGIWWGNLWDTASSDFHIFRFNAATSSWVNTGVTTETRSSTHHDVLWDGTTLYVASYRFVNDGLPAEAGYPTTMRRYSYDSGAKKYSLVDSSQINNSKIEVLTIDKDSKGLVWATWQQGNQIYLNVFDPATKKWGTAFRHPSSLSNVSVDDTSAVIAFDGNKMGVMWSRQVGDATDGMYWSYHVDGTSNTTWTTPVAAVKGQRSGDDHMNLKWLDSTDGQVFAATKTSFTQAAQPLIQLLVLNGTTWSAHTIATVSECPNRVIVLIDESTSPKTLRTFATYPKPSGTTNAGVCTSSGGAIYEKSTKLDNISFTTTKTPRIVDADQYVHNVTSTKQNLNSNARGTANSGLLVLADVNATSRYWHFYDPKGGAGGGDTTPPTAPTGLVSPGHTTSTVALAWNAATDNVGVTGYKVYRNGTQIADQTGRTYNDSGLSPATAYTYTVKAYDAAANLSAASSPLTVTTDGSADTTAPTAPTGLVSPGHTASTVALAWDAATDNVGVTGYKVYRNGTQIADQTGRTYNDSGLSPATAYTYTVKAYDAAANLSAASSPLTVTTDGSADTTAPTAPTGLVSPGHTASTVALAWDAATDNVGVTGYKVYRNGTQIADQTGRTYNDSGLSPATAYTYTVKAYDAAANLSAASSPLTVTTSAQTATGIQRQGMSTLVNATSTTSHTITKPASAAAGQVCVASLALNGSTVSAAPAGWTQFAASTSIANPHLYGYYHVMGTSEPASYTWTTAGSVASGGGISCYSGVNTTTPLDTTASVAASAVAASTGTVSGVTTTTAGAMLVGAIAINSSNTTIAITGPSGMAEVYDVGGKRTELDDALQAAAGSSGSKSWTWSSGSAREWAGWLVALRAQ